jgi:hypothetical protein
VGEAGAASARSGKAAGKAGKDAWLASKRLWSGGARHMVGTAAAGQRREETEEAGAGGARRGLNCNIPKTQGLHCNV